MKVILLSALALSLAAHADDVSDMISQAEGTAAQSASEATQFIDMLQRRAASERDGATHVMDSLSWSGSSRVTHGSTASNQPSKPNPTARVFPKQETVNDVPLAHTGKEGCHDKQAPKGRCASTLLNQANPEKSPGGTQLLIFVSQTMPKESLKSLWREAHKVGGKLLFRGLVGGSFKETQAFMQDLGIVADIDPTKFEEHAIKAIPTFMLITKENSDRLTGNVSLQSFLAEVQEKGDNIKGSELLVNKLFQGDVT